MLNSTQIASEKYKELMETISTQAEQQFVSTAQRLEHRGIKKTALRMIAKGFSNVVIAEVTDLSENEIENLREQYRLNQ